MIFASPPQTFGDMHMIGNLHFGLVCASGWEEWLIRFGSETCEEDTSMSHMSHPQLGSLILSASSAKTRIVEYGFAVRCGSSQPLWETTRSFTSTCAASYNFPAIHKSRRGCSQWLLFWFFSISSACPAFIYLKSLCVRERWNRGRTCRRGLIDLVMLSSNAVCTIVRGLTPSFPDLIWLWNDQTGTIWLSA